MLRGVSGKTGVGDARSRRLDPLDANMRRLVRALNAFPGAETIGSCGGHVNPTPAQWPEDTWYVNLVFDQSPAGHFALEFLAWAVNNDYRRGGFRVMLYPYAPPPYLNEPGRVLRYHLEGYGADPDALATFLNTMRRKHFVTAGEADHQGEPAAGLGCPG
jgi:hypothetical protein